MQSIILVIKFNQQKLNCCVSTQFFTLFNSIECVLDESPTPKVWKSIHKGPVSRLALTKNGTILVSGGSDSSVRIWDLYHNACLKNLTGLQGVVR